MLSALVVDHAADVPAEPVATSAAAVWVRTIPQQRTAEPLFSSSPAQAAQTPPTEHGAASISVPDLHITPSAHPKVDTPPAPDIAPTPPPEPTEPSPTAPATPQLSAPEPASQEIAAPPAPAPPVSALPVSALPAPVPPAEARPRVGRTNAEGREVFLDTIRAVALVRVVIWHTFATALVSWSVAAMPTMFFVAGSVLAASLERHSAREMMPRRLRRLLVPVWAYAFTILSVMAVVHQLHPSASTSMAPWRLVTWFFPMLDPKAPAWTGGWVSDPLWYLRCYLWLLLLSPMLFAIYRKVGLWSLLPSMLGIFAIDAMIRGGHAAQTLHGAHWYLGDLTTYSFFLMLGFSHREGALVGLDRRGRLEWAGLGGVAALIWVLRFDVPGNVVNNSYPLLLFVGVAWLGIFLALEPQISALGAGRLRPFVTWLGRRAVSVYLWHPVAIVGSYWVLNHLAPDAPRIAVLLMVAPATIILAVLFGRFEDLGAQRKPQWWPGKDDPWPLPAGSNAQVRITRWRAAAHRRQLPGLGLSFLIGAIVMSLGIPSAVTADEATKTTTKPGVNLPPPPSGKPDEADFGDTGATDTASATVSPNAATAPIASAVPSASASTVAGAPVGGTAAGGTTAGGATDRKVGAGKTGTLGTNVKFALDPGKPAANPANEGKPAADATVAKMLAVTDTWRQAKSVEGAKVAAILADGSVAKFTSGGATDGSDLDLAASDPITSLTKSMTASIMLQLVAEGKIGLDDPLPDLKVRPGLPWVGKVTIRQLLNHSAGVKPYDKTSGYAAVAGEPLTPVQALDLVAKDPQPLEWTPGSKGDYSNSGYTTLGLLEEQLSGKTYQELLAERIFGPAQMSSAQLNTAPAAGWVGFSSGGVDAPIGDVLAWGNALLRQQTILNSAQMAQMVNVDNSFSAGLGAFPTCPCGTNAGQRVYTSIGHQGGQISMQFAPSDNTLVVVWLTESMWLATPNQKDVFDLIASLRATAAG